MICIYISAKLELFKKQVSSLKIFVTLYSHYQTGNVESNVEFLGFHSGRVWHWASRETKIHLLPSFWWENIIFHFNKEFIPDLAAVRDFRPWFDPSIKQHLHSISICFILSWYQFIRYQFYLSEFTATHCSCLKSEKRESKQTKKSGTHTKDLLWNADLLHFPLKVVSVTGKALCTRECQVLLLPSRASGLQCPPQG